MNIYKLPVHPAANLFPMVDSEQFDSLVASIKKNGIRVPVVIGEVDGVTTLIDGRNRLAAAKEAGITDIPTHNLNGSNPEDYIIDINIERRQLSKGQQAILHAKVKPNGDVEKRGKPSGKRGVSLPGETTMREARSIVNNAPDLADSVLNQSMTMTDALKEVKFRQAEKTKGGALMASLKSEAHDLYELVELNKLDIREAYAALKTRQEDEKAQRIGRYKTFRDMTLGASEVFSNKDARIETLAFMKNNTDEFESVTEMTVAEAKKHIRSAARNLNKFAEEI